MACMIAVSCCVSALYAQSVITGTLLGYDDKPLKKSLVLMSVGGPEEKKRSSFKRTIRVGFAMKHMKKACAC